jgi:chromosome segregation ATPase
MHQAELKAMENITSDSNKVLSDKLALSREISSLRPEVEHLRAQVESNQGLLTEKLSLQRQLTTMQVELENERRTAARTLAKQGKRSEHDDDLRNELEEARKELAKEKKERAKAEAASARAEKSVEKVQSDLELQQQAVERLQAKVEKLSTKDAGKPSKRNDTHDATLEELRQELEQERSARRKAEKASKKSTSVDAEIEQLRQELEDEKRERQKAERVSKKGTQQPDIGFEEAKKAWEEIQREHKKQEREYTKTLAELQGRNTILDDKLTAFREKLRTTKEKLKEKEAELERVDKAHTAPPAKAIATLASKPAKNARKRMAATAEPETNLGTPGDGFLAKKAKRGTSVSAMGDTSTFSLTPFLNRAGSVAPASPIAEEDEEEEEEEEAIEAEPTPTTQPKMAPKKAVQLKAKPLGPAPSNKANAKVPARKKVVAPVLEMVAEEVSELCNVSRDTGNAPVTIPLKDADDGPSTKSKSAVPKFKPRKSLMSFATFAEEPAAEKKKKRKLGVSAGKTLFDAEDAEDVAPLKPVGVSKGLFAARALGKSVLGKQGLQRPISGGFNMLSEEAFSFSPLKKDRRSASILK